MAFCLFGAHVKVHFSVLHVHLKDKLLHVFSMNDKSHMVSFSYCPFLLFMCSDPRFNSTVLVSTCKPQEITQPHCPQHKSCKCSFLFFLIKCYTSVPEFMAWALFHHVCACVHVVCDAVFVADRFYTALFSELEQTRCALVIWESKLMTCFCHAFLNIRQSDVLTAQFGCLVVTWLVPHETAAVLACSVYTVQPWLWCVSCK